MSQDLEMVQSFRRMSRCSSTFFPLPTDILLYMVQFFSFEQKRSIRLVSKQFRLQADKSIKLSLGLEELISRRLFVELRLSNEFLGNIPRGLKVLKILSRSSIGNLGIQCLPPYLEWLELDECMIDDQGLEYLPRSLQVFHLKDSPNLREFWIRGANFVDGALLHMPQHITNFGVMASGESQGNTRAQLPIRFPIPPIASQKTSGSQSCGLYSMYGPQAGKFLEKSPTQFNVPSIGRIGDDGGIFKTSSFLTHTFGSIYMER